MGAIGFGVIGFLLKEYTNKTDFNFPSVETIKTTKNTRYSGYKDYKNISKTYIGERIKIRDISETLGIKSKIVDFLMLD